MQYCIFTHISYYLHVFLNIYHVMLLNIAVKAEGIREAENITNIEMNKISMWAKNNKINFNEPKSKLRLYHEGKEEKTRKSQFI